MSHLTKKVHWWPTGNPSRPWGVLFEGKDWEVAVIDVPGQQRRYSLLINGRKREEFVDWPENWTKAPDDGANASQRAEYERECEYWDKNEDVLPYGMDEDDFEDGRMPLKARILRILAKILRFLGW